jgi:hypothetical protein
MQQILVEAVSVGLALRLEHQLLELLNRARGAGAVPTPRSRT